MCGRCLGRKWRIKCSQRDVTLREKAWWRCGWGMEDTRRKLGSSILWKPGSLGPHKGTNAEGSGRATKKGLFRSFGYSFLSVKGQNPTPQ